jgi:hypothetical protein
MNEFSGQTLQAKHSTSINVTRVRMRDTDFSRAGCFAFGFGAAMGLLRRASSLLSGRKASVRLNDDDAPQPSSAPEAGEQERRETAAKRIQAAKREKTSFAAVTEEPPPRRSSEARRVSFSSEIPTDAMASSLSCVHQLREALHGCIAPMLKRTDAQAAPTLEAVVLSEKLRGKVRGQRLLCRAQASSPAPVQLVPLMRHVSRETRETE